MMNDHNGPHGTFGDRVNMHSDKELSDLLDFSAVSPSVLCQSPGRCRKNEGECSIRDGGNGRIGLLEGSKGVGGRVFGSLCRNLFVRESCTLLFCD